MPDVTPPSQMTVDPDGAPSQANTPALKDKALWVALLGFLLPLINRKFSLGLEPGEVLAALSPLAAYILGNKWKSGRIAVEEIKAKNALTLPDNLTPAQAAGLMDQLGKLAAPVLKTTALLLAIVLAVGPARAFAEPAGSDKPYAIQDGEPAPGAGVFLTTARAGAIFKECTEAKANAADLEKALAEKPGTPVAAIAISAGLGIAAGVLLTFLVARRT